MANNRKIWKSKRFCHLLFIFVLLFGLIIFFLKNGMIKGRNVMDEYNKASKDSYEQDFGAVKNFPKKIFNGLKLVHIDLKGAPPKLSYFTTFFPFIKKLGATGVLLEYEDTFPFKSFDIASKKPYSREDIISILKLANESSLEIIPLVQTFGHMEFVLKLEEFLELRESYRYPQAICPSKEKSLTVIKAIIDDVMELHRGFTNYLHIGCDEVYQIAECADCTSKMVSNKWNRSMLFLNHISTVAKYVREIYPEVTPLIWDDELRTLPISELKYWNLGSLVEIVVWKYTSDIELDLDEQLWNKYQQVFPTLWFASCFKGASSPDSINSDIRLYFENHKSWMRVVSKYSGRIHFKGGILTGWQRYDHFAVLCELLPVAFPSLAINLIYLSTDLKYLADVSSRAQNVLGCDINPAVHISECVFPGSSLQRQVFKLTQIRNRMELSKSASTYKGWFTNYNIKNSFSSPAHVEEAAREFLDILMELTELELDIERSLGEIYNIDTVDEWIVTYVKPLKNELNRIVEARDRLLSINTWPKRPLS